MSAQVMSRCPCKDKKLCGKLEERVKAAAAKGLLPPFPLEDGRQALEHQLGIETW